MFRLTRRHGQLALVGLLAATAALTACSDEGRSTAQSAQSTDSTSERMPTVVLVHGAFATGASWDGVTPILEDAGYAVVAPELPLQSLAGDATVLADTLDAVDGPTILVGHSYGGIVMSEVAANDPDVAALVFVAAFAPAEGESIAALQGAYPGSKVGPDTLAFARYIRDDGTTGTAVSIRPERFAEVFGGDLPAEIASAAAETQRALDFDVLTTASGPSPCDRLPSWALIPTADNVIPVAGARAMAARCGADVAEIDASHAVLVSHPQAVVDLVDAATASLK